MVPLPAKFIERIKNQYPYTGEQLLRALQTPPPVSIRLNPEKSYQITHNYPQVAWSKNGIYLPERPVFTLDPLFHAGVYYPQEAASMVIEYIANHLQTNYSFNPDILLDAAAAPGGKTLILSGAFPDALLIANEYIAKRAVILTENIARWGTENVVVTNNDTAHFAAFQQQFDLILLDAPCSGEGMFRKDENARTEWSESNLNVCVARQAEIINNLLPILNPGGFLIYSTCTFNPNENELLVEQKLLPDGFSFIPLDELLKFGVEKAKNGLGYYFFPGKTQSEGLFVSVWQKDTAAGEKRKTSHISHKKQPKTAIPPPPVTIPGNKKLTTLQNHFFAVPEMYFPAMLNRLNVKYAGVKLGYWNKNKWKPATESVLTPHYAKQFPTIDLTGKQAMQYLKGETTFLHETSFKKGFYTVTFRDIPLGLIHHLGNRLNNLYPKPWRIKMNINSVEHTKLF